MFHGWENYGHTKVGDNGQTKLKGKLFEHLLCFWKWDTSHIMIFGSPRHIILVNAEMSQVLLVQTSNYVNVEMSQVYRYQGKHITLFTPWEKQSSLKTIILKKYMCMTCIISIYLLSNFLVVDAFESIRCPPNTIFLQKFAQNDFILMYFYVECSMSLRNANHCAIGFKILLLQTVVELRNFIDIGT